MHGLRHLAYGNLPPMAAPKQNRAARERVCARRRPIAAAGFPSERRRVVMSSESVLYDAVLRENLLWR